MGMLKKIIGMPDGDGVEAHFEDTGEDDENGGEKDSMNDEGSAQEQAPQEQAPQEQAPQEQAPDYEGIIAEAIKHKDAAFYEAFAKAVKAEVERRVGGEPPRADNGTDDAAALVKFRKMGYKQRLELLKADPVTYQKLVKLDRE